MSCRIQSVHLILFLALLCSGLLCACGASSMAVEQSVAAPSSSPFHTTTSTPEPTITSRPESTATSTATCTPEPTATSTSTPTATPTLGPPPRIVASYPIDGDQEVIGDRPIVLVFDQAMDAASVQSSLTISPNVPSEMTWPIETRIEIRPQTPWSEDMTYTVRLTDAQSRTGTHLEHPWQITFGTGRRGAPIPVLMYHHILELGNDATEGQRTWTVSPEAFREQMAYLIEHQWQTVTPAQLVTYLSEGEPLPVRPLLITIDDGYKEVHSIVADTLRETDLSPVLFVVPQYVGYSAYLDWAMLQDLVAAGMTVGVHSYDHSALKGLSADDLEYQVSDSRTILEEKLGVTCDSFCYPYGSYDDKVIKALQNHDYTCAFTLNPSIYQHPYDTFRLSRSIVTYDTSMVQFIGQLGVE